MNLIPIEALPELPYLTLIWLVMLLGAVIIAALPGRAREAIRWTAASVALISLLLSLLVYLAYDPQGRTFQFVEQAPWIPSLGISYFVGVDGIGIAMLLLNGLVIFTGTLISWNIEHRTKEYFVLLLLLVVGVYGVFMSLDLFLFFVFYELAVLPMYLLIAVWGSTRKEYGAMKLTLYLMVGSAFAIIGLIAVYFGSGLRTFNLIDLANLSPGFSTGFQIAFFLPLFVGFGVLAGMFPFHTWSPTGHVAAPTAVSMLHAGVLMKLGAFGCLRAAIWLMPVGAQIWAPLIVTLTLFNVVYGAYIAMAQRDFKYVIGYSSVSHMGFVVMGLAALNATALNGAVLQMFAHGIMTALFFAVVGRMVYDRTHTRQLPELGGLGRVMPLAAVLFILGGLSSMGMPGTAGFFAEFNIFLGVWQRFPLVAALAGLAIPITAAYVLRVTRAVFFGAIKNPAFYRLPKLTWQEWATGLILAPWIIAVGLFPNLLHPMIDRSVAPVVQRLEVARARLAETGNPLLGGSVSAQELDQRP
ncbi:complex I subunit 4 family protein [Kallotenue papyrolyticum]|uniref:complex I subunit 4 family protein n=1 Tax=Kallotenue papyrolyticum TaxID=1325125 RepID=UPI00047865F9|nr:NADH-quinone oxidoreductase subunit M [Kallotenue papyrolyticum]